MPRERQEESRTAVGTRREFIHTTMVAGAGLWLPVSSLLSGEESSSTTPQPEALEALLGAGAHVRVTPDTVWRELPTCFEIAIRLGAGGLARDDSLGIVHGSYIDRWKFGFPSHWWGEEPPWQVTDPAQTNHVKAVCSRPGVNMQLRVGVSGGRKPYVNQRRHFLRSIRERMRFVLEISADEELQPGDTVTVQWGNSHRKDGVEPPPYAASYFFLPFRFSRLPREDYQLPIRRGNFRALPTVRVRGRDAVRFHLAARPLIAVGENFELRIAAIDRYGNLAEDFTGDVVVSSTSRQVQAPEKVVFSEEDRGVKVLSGLRANQSGWVCMTASRGEVSGRSNYLVISEETPSNRLYFGDMHTHTLDCDGTVEIDEHFRYACGVVGLDFGAVSCHAEYFGCREAWSTYLEKTTTANEPGRFVTFYGYEWANQGHINAYFLAPEDVLLIAGSRMESVIDDQQAFRVFCTTEGELMQKLRSLKQPVFCIAHCHTKYGDKIDDHVLWLDEIYSMHRHKRAARENRLRRNLERGLRLGVVAGSDMHRMAMGHLCETPGEKWPQGGWENCQYETAGLQAVFAPDLTRGELYEAMKARQTYGTSGARIVLLFSCGGDPMGSQVELKRPEKPEFRIEIGGTATLTEVAICRFDGSRWTEPLRATPDRADRWSASWQDADFDEQGIYYVRVVQSDGHRAWSSPIWITRANC